jgi:hypothetical protein
MATGLCMDCNYPLRDLAESRCPECGRAFVAHDPRTMNMGAPITATILWLLGPVRWPTRVILLAAAGVTLWFARLPVGQSQIAGAGKYIWIGVLGLWIALPVARWIIARQNGWRRSQLQLGRKRWGGFIAMALLVLAIQLHLPFKASLKISRPAMDALAKKVTTATTPDYKDRWVGVYPAKHLQKVPGGIKFTVEDTNAHYKAGFVYLPTVNPKTAQWKAYTYIGQGWWMWREEG